MADRDPALLALHRYYIWANRMRTHFDEVIQGSVYGGARSEIESFLYMSYWYGGLFVVIEGWRELGLSEPTVDKLLASPNVELLRRYRNGVFHFQRDYNDDRFLAFMREGEKTVPWVRDVTLHLGRYFLQRFRPDVYGPIPPSERG